MVRCGKTGKSGLGSSRVNWVAGENESFLNGSIELQVGLG